MRVCVLGKRGWGEYLQGKRTCTCLSFDQKGRKKNPKKTEGKKLLLHRPFFLSFFGPVRLVCIFIWLSPFGCVISIVPFFHRIDIYKTRVREKRESTGDNQSGATSFVSKKKSKKKDKARLFLRGVVNSMCVVATFIFPLACLPFYT
jgi:hypothetical protein